MCFVCYTTIVLVFFHSIFKLKGPTTTPAITEPNDQLCNVNCSCQHTVVSLTGGCQALHPGCRETTCKLVKKILLCSGGCESAG
jgi:hypothetical protein